ncbi:MAG: hypothetical protein JSV32_08630 [Dehalococcoidia bacterium]|nr:MAG: hypothetical protein JSV32_08630 [Dehalococcoidia bacterium]
MSRYCLIENAFEELCHSLRILLEADFRANHGGLLLADRAEAVGNIEAALTSVLNAFHSLYDAITKQLGSNPISWYETGPLAFVIAIRNARHHNIANRIRSLYTYHTQEAERIQHMEQYVLVDYPIPDEGADTFDVFISWEDLKILLSLPRKENKLPKSTCNIIKEYLNTGQYSEYAKRYNLPESRVFINVVPLLVNAAATLVPYIKEYCCGDSSESKFFREHFSTVGHADTKKHEVDCGPFVLPQ